MTGGVTESSPPVAFIIAEGVEFSLIREAVVSTGTTVAAGVVVATVAGTSVVAVVAITVGEGVAVGVSAAAGRTKAKIKNSIRHLIISKSCRVTSLHQWFHL